PIGYSGLENRKGAFKMPIKKVNGRWYLYMGHLWHYVWSIVDVTDPGEPKFLKTVPGPGNTWTIQMTLHDNIMITALEKSSLAWGADPNRPNETTEEGVRIWDISDPAHPKEAGRWWMPGQKAGEAKPEGPEGFHGPANISLDGKMASMAYSPAVVNLDITDVANPKLIGKLN